MNSQNILEYFNLRLNVFQYGALIYNSNYVPEYWIKNIIWGLSHLVHYFHKSLFHLSFFVWQVNGSIWFIIPWMFCKSGRNKRHV